MSNKQPNEARRQEAVEQVIEKSTRVVVDETPAIEKAMQKVGVHDPADAGIANSEIQKLIDAGLTEEQVELVKSLKTGFNAQDSGMVASMRSRSMIPHTELTAKVHERGSDEFAEKFYVGYGGGKTDKAGSLPGHGSIMQSGSTNVTLEGISMLAAVAFEDHALFNGQENSTRYIKGFKKKEYVMPAVHADDEAKARAIIEEWFDIYVMVYEGLVKEYRETKPCPDDVEPAVWEKALDCMALDKASGFLPLATKTNITWHTHLDNLNTQHQNLQSYPLKEVRHLAKAVENRMGEVYDKSTKRQMPAGHREWLNERSANIFYSELSTSLAVSPEIQYHISDASERMISWSLEASESHDTPDTRLLITSTIEDMLMTRPRYMYLPPVLKSAGAIQVHGVLDFASFRELHRHRDGHIPVPYLTYKSGMHSWYLQSLPRENRFDIEDRILDLFERIRDFYRVAPYESQYLLPMGIRCIVEMNCAFPQLVYISELRSGHACRYPIRQFAQACAHRLQTAFPNMKLYANMEGEQVYAQRAKQDIVTKDENGNDVSIQDSFGK